MNSLLKAIDKLIKQEKPKKRKSIFELPQEKRLNYYSGWSKGKSVKVKIEKQNKLV